MATTEQVWHGLHDRLLRFIRARVPDPGSAEDILQEVFLKIYTRIDTLKDDDRLESWVYRIVRNAIADHHRAQRPTAALLDLVAAPEDEPPDDLLRELAPGLGAMLDALPAADREALILTEIEGLAQQELADRLGLSLSGAKSRVQRARRRLKAVFVGCCQLEFDRRGRVIEYRPGCAACVEESRRGDEDLRIAG